MQLQRKQIPEMAGDLNTLKVDGFLDISTTVKSPCIQNIVLHPILNVLLVFDDKNCVTVFDVNSGKILQSCKLSGK